MEFVETIFEWLGKAGQIAAIGAGIFLIVVGLVNEKWSRVGLVTAGVIVLLPFLSWAFQETPLFIFFQKAKIVGQVVAVPVAIVSIIFGKWESGIWRALFLIVGILMLMPLTNFVFRFVSILFSLLLR